MDADRFIRNWQQSDADAIRFAWNGKHGEAFVDKNIEFRREIALAVVAAPDAAPLQLVRELLDAETACAKEAFGINRYVHRLAGILLRRGGAGEIETFLRCKFRSMDTSMECAQVELPEALASEFVTYCTSKAAAATSPQERRLWENGVEVFKSKVGHG